MKFLYAILLLTAAVAMADRDDDAWNFYKFQFGKVHSPQEEATRRQNFLARDRVIEKHNRENKGWQMAHNKFSDMSEDEKLTMLGAKPTIRRERSVGVAYPIEDRQLPASIDYRTDKCMQPVKDQGSCGSCWSFASTVPIEFKTCKKTGTAVALSEQMLVDCDTYNNGCDGGMYTEAWQYIIEKGGIMKSSDYTYTSGTTELKGTSCKYSSTLVAAKVTAYGWTMPYPNATVSMTYLQNEGPLPSAMKVLNSIYNYASGVYSDPACIVTDEYDINHAIVVVGYGTTTATTTTPATPYWIVRNSWGTGWGLSGYFLIKRGVNMCNIESWTAYVRVA